MSNDLPMSDTEARLYNLLSTMRDVTVSVLFRSVTRRWPGPALSTRRQQMRLGPNIHRLNVKLEREGVKIVPGQRRNSYRLTKISG